MVEVRKSAFDFETGDKRSLSWTPIQFWAIMKALATVEAVRYKFVPVSESILQGGSTNTDSCLFFFFFFSERW